MVHLSRRPAVLITSSALLLLFLVTIFFSQTRNALSSFFIIGGSPNVTKGLHYILPATSTNADACKLLFASSVLGYPDPILIGWGGHGRWNGSENHLFKFPVLLEYFASLRPDQDDDLVFLLDAFDIWLQLPPEILIQRYLLAIEKENARLERNGLLDKSSNQGIPIRNTMLFGADRLCWPQDKKQTIPCWASPESLLPQYIMGPATDVGRPEDNGASRPRHLNSGTLIGPVKAIRDFFQATYDRINVLYNTSTHGINSDQFYLHILWDEQEEARLGILNGTWDIGGSNRTEFGVTVDGEGDAYQLSLYMEYVTWMSFNHSSAKGKKKSTPVVRLDQLELEQAILDSPKPFPGGSWKDVMLGMNVLTGSVFPMFHITPQKWVRDAWWPRMWFHSFRPEELLEAARRKWLANVRSNNGQHVVATVDGVTYVAARGGKRTMYEDSALRGGVWNDLGDYMPWGQICGQHEEAVFLTE